MHLRTRLALSLAIVLLGGCGTRRSSTGDVTQTPAPVHATPMLTNTSPFAPAFTRLDTSSAPLDVGALGDPVQCVGCHADTVAQWDPSAHRNSSFSNRFYALGVDLTRKHRGNKVSRWCAGCHDPSLLLDVRAGAHDKPNEQALELAIDRDDVVSNPRAGDGVGCLVCHSITEGSRTGGGGYLLKWKRFIEPELKDAASIAQHKVDMKPPVMAQGEFCASCHKVSLHADVNGKRWYRGQNDFDAWEQGPYGLGGRNSAGEIYAPDVQKARCQDCHMPHETVTKGDLAGKVAGTSGAKSIRSHRFLAANTAVATFAGDHETVERQRAFLRGVVRVDIIGVRHASSPMRVMLRAGGDVTSEGMKDGTSDGTKEVKDGTRDGTKEVKDRTKEGMKDGTNGTKEATKQGTSNRMNGGTERGTETSPIQIMNGEDILLDVVVENTSVGHRFPSTLR